MGLALRVGRCGASERASHAGPGSPELGLGLWRNIPVELTLEAVMTVAALVLYLRAAQDHPGGRRIGMVVYVILLGALAIGGQATATEPVGRSALIANWIAALGFRRDCLGARP